MAAEVIGTVKSGSGKSYQVKWNRFSKETYVSYAGWTYLGKANSPEQAMNKARAFLADK